MFWNKNKKTQKIVTSPLPGFVDLLPAEQIAFNKMRTDIESVYKRFGFIPMDNPVIERAEVLFANAGGDTEKEIYRIKKGDNDLALRFDLTVPLARYVSENYNNISFPFRRYQIGKVYRGERPQKGRFREFYQADIDIIGDGELNLQNDAEIPSIIYSIFKRMNVGPFTIRINNRKIISGFIESLGLEDKNTEILRAVDKLEKIGSAKVSEILKQSGINADSIGNIFKILDANKGGNKNVLKNLQEMSVESSLFDQGIIELETVIKNAQQFGIPEDNIKIDLSIARGLDYYTGTVYETFLADYPEIGSVCSGGRYDNLAERYTDKKLPGVGISIGLTRLFSQLKERGLVKIDRKTSTQVLVVPLIDDLEKPIYISSKLRRQGIRTEIYLEEGNIKKKMKYANKQGIPYVLIVGEDEVKSGMYTLKDMQSGVQKQLTEDNIKESI